MIQTIRRTFSIYGAFAAMVPKLFLAYSIWVWMQFITQVIALIIFVAFWKAVYAGQVEISGLSLDQTLTYIILAQLFVPAAHGTGSIFHFGQLMREGLIGIELLRPVDFQAASYVNMLGRVAIDLLLQLPLALIAWLLFRFQIPTNPLIWLAFIVTLFLGNGVIFFFDWILGCVAFYSTEIWGLGVLRYGIALFFSGAFVPLAMMPGWLQAIANTMPFAQALYVPVSLLSGITPLGQVPAIWFRQGILLLLFGLFSRLVFQRAVRKVTVQGG